MDISKTIANITMIFAGILISTKANIFSRIHFCGNVPSTLATYTLFFISNTFVSNARLKLAKK